MLKIKQQADEAEKQNVVETENSSHAPECDNELSSASDKFPAPSTPQLKRGCRFSSDQDCQDNTNFSAEKVPGDLEENSKFVETTGNHLVAETTSDNSHSEVSMMAEQSSVIDEAMTVQHSLESSKDDSNLDSHLQKKVIKEDSVSEVSHQRRSSLHPSSMQMWGHPGFPAWHPQDSWSWNAYPGMHDAWGRPLLPPSQGSCSSFPQYSSGYDNSSTFEDGKSIPKGSFDIHPVFSK